MKRRILTGGMLLMCLRILAQEPVDVKSTIKEVTVYLQNAQITREAQVQVVKGDNYFKFPALETSIDPQSIQASAPEMVLLNSVRHEVNYLKNTELSPEMKMLQDSIKLVTELISKIDLEDDVLNREAAMIQANQSIGSKEKGLTADQLAKMADFYRNRMSAIQNQRYKLSLDKRKLNTTTQRLGNQIAPLTERLNQPSNDIVVHVKSEYARNISLAVRYVVTGAAWVPSYDLRASDLTKPIRLDYRAEVQQTTGIDWKDVKLTLSTGDPNRGGTKPELQQWNLYTQVYRNTVNVQGTRTTTGAYTMDSKGEDGYGGGRGMLEQQTLANYTTVTEGAVMTEFSISIPQNIPADGKSHQVFIQKSDLPASFHHFAAPKLDQDAFLLAAVTGWESLNLLPGEVNIFFEGTYVSRAFMNPSATSDTLNFSLGRDPKVVVKREMLQDHNSQRTIGMNKERTFGYEISVRNTKSTPVILDLQDQVPISQDASIEVKVIEISSAEHNTETGLLKWRMTLQPNETKKVRLVYSIKYPKNKVISGI